MTLPIQAEIYNSLFNELTPLIWIEQHRISFSTLCFSYSIRLFELHTKFSFIHFTSSKSKSKLGNFLFDKQRFAIQSKYYPVF